MGNLVDSIFKSHGSEERHLFRGTQMNCVWKYLKQSSKRRMKNKVLNQKKNYIISLEKIEINFNHVTYSHNYNTYEV